MKVMESRLVNKSKKNGFILLFSRYQIIFSITFVLLNMDIRNV